MGINYEPLRVTLAKKRINLSQLRKMIGCSPTTLTRIGKNLPISMSIIHDICSALQVNIEEVVTITRE